MDAHTLLDASLEQARDAVRGGRIAAWELTACAIDRIERDEDARACFMRLRKDEAIQEARACHGGGALPGIPVAHKDIFSIRGEVASCATSPGLRRRADTDTEVLLRVKEAGAIDLGGLHLAEFAMGASGWNEVRGYLRNPLDPDRVSGGSSSGSAAAVARKLVFGALGTDTGGSIRVPSSFCGVVGLKPTNGLVSIQGVFPVSPTLDTVGPLARTVRDCAIMLDGMQSAVAAEKALDLPFEPAELGILEEASLPTPPDAEAALALDRVRAACAKAGLRVRPLSTTLPGEANALSGIVFLSEAAAVHLRHLREKPELLGPQVRNRLLLGLTYPAAVYIRALEERATMLKRWIHEMPSLVLLPSTPCLPPLRNSYDGMSADEIIALNGRLGSYTAFANYLGLPALSLPVPLSGGMSLGVQIVGRPGEDARVLQLASLLERMLA
ncbi:MAG: amidase [Desulfovibrionaceae bacterium]|nr:amidase [Desulfovibrionaceae bacterium]